MHNDEFQERGEHAAHAETPQFDLEAAQEMLKKIARYQELQGVVVGNNIMNSIIEKARPKAAKIVEKVRKKDKTVAAYNEEQLKTFHETVLAQVAKEELMEFSRRATNYTAKDWMFYVNYAAAGATMAVGAGVGWGLVTAVSSTVRKYTSRTTTETTTTESPFTASARPARRHTTHETVSAI